MASTIEARGLNKLYGNFHAIEDVSFDVKKGEILGFLGPNAAGKTTTMRIVTGFMPPSSGTVTIAGHDVISQSLEARRLIGYLPETVPLYTDMTVTGYLHFMGTLRGMKRDKIKTRTSDVIDICKLGDYQNTFIGKLSKGFRQRVGIAQAIIHEPEVLVLDEPTIGIDPIQVVETRKLIKDLGQEHTIILSTHVLPEVSMVCQRVLIIHQGQIMAEDSPTNLAERLKGVDRIEIEAQGPTAEIMGVLRNVKGIIDVSHSSDGDNSKFSVQVRHGQDLRNEISKAIIENGWQLLGLQLMSMSLEDIFIQLITKEA